MTRFLAGRFLQSVISMFFLVTVVFFLMRLTGDPAARMIPVEAPMEVQESIRRRFGLDKPLIEQFWLFFREMFKGDLGQSLYFQRDVTDLLGRRILPSLQLASPLPRPQDLYMKIVVGIAHMGELNVDLLTLCGPLSILLHTHRIWRRSNSLLKCDIQ